MHIFPSCPKIDSKLSPSCLKVVLKLSQSGLKVVSSKQDIALVVETLSTSKRNQSQGTLFLKTPRCLT